MPSSGPDYDYDCDDQAHHRETWGCGGVRGGCRGGADPVCAVSTEGRVIMRDELEIERARFNGYKAEVLWADREPTQVDSPGLDAERLKAERAVLGWLLRGCDLHCLARLEFDHFSSWRHRYILVAIGGLAALSFGWDVFDVVCSLKATGHLLVAGGAGYVTELALDAARADELDIWLARLDSYLPGEK